MFKVYVASKTKHAPMWRVLRSLSSELGFVITSTWIDEAGPGQTDDFEDLWARCLHESGNCNAFLIYREPDEVLKGALIELGVALWQGIDVYAVGLEEFTIAKSGKMNLIKSLEQAIQLIRNQAITYNRNEANRMKREDDI